jgi:hypothetical protein
MMLWTIRRAIRLLTDLFRRSPGPADDPYAYAGARRKPRPSAGSAGVALEEPRYLRTDAKGRRVG